MKERICERKGNIMEEHKTKRLRQLILSHLDFTESISDGELQELIYEVLREYSKEEYVSIEERIQLEKELFNTFRKLDLLQELLEDSNTTEIMINGLQNIFIEQEGKIRQLKKGFQDQRKLEDVIQQIVSQTNRMVNESTPIADARLEDGSRVHIVLPPVALDGPIVTIRKFPESRVDMKGLVSLGSLSEEMVKLLECLVKSKYNILISGGTGSGKTTFLNALSKFIPVEERIITIEDNAELQLQEIPNLVRLETRAANIEGEGEISIRDLVHASLRMRPNRIIVGEVRGAEAADVLMVFNTGHDGSLCTLHANTTRDMLFRLETLVLMGIEIPVQAIRRQIASAIDIMIHIGRVRDGSRKVMEIAEILGIENGEIQVSTIYKFCEKERNPIESEGKEVIKGESAYGKWKEEEPLDGYWEYVNPLVQKEKLLAAGYT